jgi:hypothetical protein
MKTFRSIAVSESLSLARENAEGTDPGSVEREQIEILQNFLKDPAKEIDLALESIEHSNRGMWGRGTVWMKPVILAMTSRSG